MHYAHPPTCMHAHTCTYMCTHTHIHMHSCTYAHMHAHTHTHTCTCIHTYTCMHMHSCTYAHTHAHMHTQIHTDMRSMSKPFPMVPNPVYGPVYETIDQNISPLPNQNFAPPSPYGNIPLHPAAEPSLDSKFTHFNPEAAVQCNENVDALTEIIPSSVMSEDNYTVMHSPTSTVPPVQPQPAEHENTTMRYVSN